MYTCTSILQHTGKRSYGVFKHFLYRHLSGHPNIVQYYGSAKGVDKGTLIPLLVMEKCTTDLYTRMIEDTYANPNLLRNPGKWQPDGSQANNYSNALQYFRGIVIQLCQGLGFMHRKGLVHRDLKLPNILVSARCIKYSEAYIEYNFVIVSHYGV